MRWPQSDRYDAMKAGSYLLFIVTVGCVDLEQRVPMVVESWCDTAKNVDVDCIIDGDTVDLAACGEDGERIRMLGVDAPEIAHEPDPADCYGDESHAWLEEMLSGMTVWLDFDTECSDMYGRTLGWLTIEGDADDALAETLEEVPDLDVFEEDGSYRVLVNELEIRLGYASVYDESFAQDVRYYERLLDAEAAAIEEGLGLWSACEDDR